MEVDIEGAGESVSNVDGDGGVCLAEEFACCVGIGVEVVCDEGVDNFGIEDEDGREAKWVCFKCEAEGVSLSLVDVGSGGADEGWDAVGADETGMSPIVKALGISDGEAQCTQNSGGSGAGVGGVMAAICCPDEGRGEDMCNVFKEAKWVRGLVGMDAGGGRGMEEGWCGEGIMWAGEEESGGCEKGEG